MISIDDLNEKLAKEGYVISTDKDKIDMECVYAYLHQESYWASGIPRQVVEACVENALCFGIYKDNVQVGFARIISDYATFAYLADVFVIKAHRGKGLSKILLHHIKQHPKLQGLRRWMLATADAHALYTQFGFSALSDPERIMEIVKPYLPDNNNANTPSNTSK